MSKNSITDFTCLINNHIKIHEDIDHHLLFLGELMAFTFSCDFSKASAESVRAQQLHLSQVLRDIKQMNENLQAQLFQSLQAINKESNS